MSEFDGIEGEQGWSDKLGSLLDEAKQQAKNGEFDARLALSSRLTDFVVRSRPNTAAIRRLDEVAAKAAESLLLAALEERVAAIVARTAELASLTKELEATAAQAQAEARALRLERLQSAVEGLTRVAATLGALEGVVAEVTDGALKGDVRRVVGDLHQLRNALEGIA